MCCPTGICGPTIDQTLLDVNEMVMTLQSQGIGVVRYQMTSHPNAFLATRSNETGARAANGRPADHGGARQGDQKPGHILPWRK